MACSSRRKSQKYKVLIKYGHLLSAEMIPRKYRLMANNWINRCRIV
jgi:hypothetical protein